MRSIEFRDALLREINRHGVTRYEVKKRGKHPKLVFEFNGRRISITYPSSPSEQRGLKNAISALRHRMGVISNDH